MIEKQITNYPAAYFSFKDLLNDSVKTLAAIPMRLQLSSVINYLKFEVWESKSDFENGNLPLSAWAEEFRIEQINDPQIAQMKASALEWLGLSDDYEIVMLDINLTLLTVTATAQHKTRTNKRVTDMTASAEEFEQIKADYPELVQAFAVCSWTYGKTHGKNLANFN